MNRHGPLIEGDGVTFRLWAPTAERVDLVIGGERLPMPDAGNGWRRLKLARAGPGTRYHFDDGKGPFPDPASRFQPGDVFGESEIVDPDAYRWRSTEWRGRSWRETVICELHVGAFTQEGTYRAAIDRLDALADAGITAIELMPLSDFAGSRNWGYDGVLPFAPDGVYGRPDELKALVDAAHQRGLMVFLDVVYNHFGPEGNFLPRYGAAFFDKAATPWGQAIDYAVPQVRQFAIENALYWLSEFRFDGLRLDAVHAIVEPGEPSILHDVSMACGELAASGKREIHLVLENDDNRAGLLQTTSGPPDGRYRAQWNDDYHHAFHVLLTGEEHGYYEDYKRPAERLLRALTSGFAYQGEASPHRGGRRRGEPTDGLPPTAFVNFLQNHDQIGNRPMGDRLTSSVPPQRIEAALAVTLLAPSIPLLFMGEEWGSRTPFPFFCDFTGDLAEAVRKGRQEEFRAAYGLSSGTLPDPLDEATFRSAILDWNERAAHGKARLGLVRDLLHVRAIEVVPFLDGAAAVEGRMADGAINVLWELGRRRLILVANLGEGDADPPPVEGRSIWGGGIGRRLGPWSVHWFVG
jgi:malto-oligosyltrehalose trehalohydrolase